MKAFLLLFILIFSTDNFARENSSRNDGDSVNNGGGIAELQMARAFAGFEQQIAPLCSRKNSCNLTDEELEALTLAQKIFPIDLHFTTERLEQGFVWQGADVLTIDANFLYESASRPKSFQEISRWAYEILFMRVLKGQEKAKYLSDKISSQFSPQTVQIYNVRFNEEYANIFHIKNKTFSDLLLLETEESSYDLLPLFSNKELCLKPHKIALENLDFLNDFSNNIRLVGKVKMDCPREISALFQINLSLTDKKELKKEIYFSQIKRAF